MWFALPNTRVELFHGRHVMPKALALGEEKRKKKNKTHTQKTNKPIGKREGNLLPCGQNIWTQ